MINATANVTYEKYAIMLTTRMSIYDVGVFALYSQYDLTLYKEI